MQTKTFENVIRFVLEIVCSELTKIVPELRLDILNVKRTLK